MAAYSIGK